MWVFIIMGIGKGKSRVTELYVYDNARAANEKGKELKKKKGMKVFRWMRKVKSE